MTTKAYIGRYAPSPSGEQHIGNLRTALLGWLHARLHNGQFLVRMEDLDTPRVVRGSADGILRDLQLLGIDWDGEVLYQSARQADYQAALDQLRDAGLTYACFCSRKDIQLAASAPHVASAAYPGICANLSAAEAGIKRRHKVPATRLKVSGQPVELVDGCLGPQSEHLVQTCGDFVIKRADNVFAYQLAVVVDDLYQAVTHVVRGADLSSSSARQIYLAGLLAPKRRPIWYFHVPLMMDPEQQRMSKRDGSESLTQWLGDGKTVEQLVGSIAADFGLIDKHEPLSSGELLLQLTADRFSQTLEKCSL